MQRACAGSLEAPLRALLFTSTNPCKVRGQFCVYDILLLYMFVDNPRSLSWELFSCLECILCDLNSDLSHFATCSAFSSMLRIRPKPKVKALIYLRGQNAMVAVCDIHEVCYTLNWWIQKCVYWFLIIIIPSCTVYKQIIYHNLVGFCKQTLQCMLICRKLGAVLFHWSAFCCPSVFHWGKICIIHNH